MAPLWARIVDACRVAGRDPRHPRPLAKFLRVEEPQITACVSAHSDVHVHPTEPDRPSAGENTSPPGAMRPHPGRNCDFHAPAAADRRRQIYGQTTLFDAA